MLRTVRRIQLRAARLVQSQLGGDYHSAYKGTGLSFDQVREYEPGDDIRSIDWNVTARAGKPFIKRYIEERELIVYILADLSASHDFGTTGRTKREAAAELAALIALAALLNNDKVGFLGFTDRIERFIPPGKGSRHALRLLRDILALRPQGRTTDLNAALDHLNKVQKRRATVFILSDFHGAESRKPLERTGRQHDATAIRILDPLECELPSVGLVNMQDPETGVPVLLDTSDAGFRREFEKSVRTRDVQLRKLLSRAGLDFLDLRNDGTHTDSFVKFFHQRARQRGALRS